MNRTVEVSLMLFGALPKHAASAKHQLPLHPESGLFGREGSRSRNPQRCRNHQCPASLSSIQSRRMPNATTTACTWEGPLESKLGDSRNGSCTRGLHLNVLPKLPRY